MDAYLVFLSEQYDKKPFACWECAYVYGEYWNIPQRDMLFWEKSKLGFIKYIQYLNDNIRRYRT